jgi:hypothetical protein|tara:strand:+ start:1373 stop:1600 length:228 start_codon:yes stop_codon:yes gene_type:complete
MNVKSVFSTIGDVVSGFAGVLGGLVTVGVMAQIIFGAGTLGMDIVGNIAALVSTFLTGGLTGLLTLIVLLAMWDK